MTIIKKQVPLLFLSLMVSTSIFAQQGNIILDNDFIKNSSLEFRTKNMWKYLNEEETWDNKKNDAPKNIHAAWGQGITLNYKSGYLFDLIGFDSSYYGAIDLDSSSMFDTRGVLAKNSRGTSTGYSKFGQRYAKVKLGDKEMGGNLYYGWKTLSRYGVLTTSTRLSPNTYLGTSGDFHYQDFVLRAAYVTKSINRNSQDKVYFQTQSKKNIDSIITGDVSYQWQDLKGTYGYGVAHDYQERHILLLDYTLDNHWKIATQIYGAEGKSDWKSMDAKNKAFDSSAWHYVASANWSSGDIRTQFGLGYTRANKTEGVGYYPRHISRNTRGNFVSKTSAGADYTRNKELALFGVIDYQLTEEFDVGFQVNYGQFDYQDKTVRSGEVALYSTWTPKSGYLKGLSIFTKVGPGIAYIRNDRTPVFKNGEVQHRQNLGMDFIAEYRFNLF